MSQMIQCPTCSKKFKLPDRPPATFTCTGCQTVMDLSGFREAAPAEAAPAPEPAARTSPTRSTSRSSSGGSGSSRSRSGASSGASSRSKGRASRDGGDEEEGGGRAPKPKDNTMLIASLIGVVVLGGITFLVMRSKGSPTTTKVVAKEPDVDWTAGMGSGAPAPVPEPAMDEAPAPAPAFVPPSKVQFRAIEHHPDATPEERTKIDALIQTSIFENAGSDSRLAGTELVGIGMKAAPRLINVFVTVKMGAGFDDRIGKQQCSLADGLLRRIDGYIERKVGRTMTQIKPQSDHAWVEKVTRNWIAWWENGKYKEPLKPWDERIDGGDKETPATPAMKADDAPDGGGGK